MKIWLEKIVSDDLRKATKLSPGEVVAHQVELNIDGQRRQFSAYVRAKVQAGWDANLVYGDELLETLLRFDAFALNDLYAAVGKCRWGVPIELPILLVNTEEDRLRATAENAAYKQPAPKSSPSARTLAPQIPSPSRDANGGVECRHEHKTS